MPEAGPAAALAASQLIETLVPVVIAPLLAGWVAQCRAWFGSRSGPGMLQPWRVLLKLFAKESVVARDTSFLLRFAPYCVFGCMVLAASIVPMVAAGGPFSPAADVIALVGLLATARVFMALAAMDAGTAFGSMGARREMLVAGLAEPALLMVFFMPSLIVGSTSLTTIVETLAYQPFALHPSLAFAAVAFVMVLLAENGRIPVDNPATHLELSMIHEATLLEYSGRHLALMEWAHALKLLVYAGIGIALFLPLGIAPAGRWDLIPMALAVLAAKLFIGGLGLAFLETVSARMRIFRAPEFLGMAYLLAVLGMLTLLLQGPPR